MAAKPALRLPFGWVNISTRNTDKRAALSVLRRMAGPTKYGLAPTNSIPSNAERSLPQRASAAPTMARVHPEISRLTRRSAEMFESDTAATGLRTRWYNGVVAD